MASHLVSPYPSSSPMWLRGNLHTHTTRSDGWADPDLVIAAYERAGYDFLAISDHDILTPLEEYRPATPMVLIEATEVSANGPHVLGVGVSAAVHPDAARQRAIDDIARLGGFSLLNHPCWQEHYNHFPQEQMEALVGYAGIEIYNGVVEFLEGSALATDRWDRLLSSGRMVWGFANDDTHRAKGVGLGWNMVAADERTPAGVIAALRRGSFYASTGVTIDSIEVDGDRLGLRAASASRVRFVGSWGRLLASVDGPEAEYQVVGNEGGYIRCELLGTGGRAAWTQPFVVPG